jgi:hypothetical protein
MVLMSVSVQSKNDGRKVVITETLKMSENCSITQS